MEIRTCIWWPIFKAHRNGVPDDYAYRPAMPYELHSPQRTRPHVPSCGPKCRAYPSHHRCNPVEGWRDGGREEGNRGGRRRGEETRQSATGGKRKGWTETGMREDLQILQLLQEQPTGLPYPLSIQLRAAIWARPSDTGQHARLTEEMATMGPLHRAAQHIVTDLAHEFRLNFAGVNFAVKLLQHLLLLGQSVDLWVPLTVQHLVDRGRGAVGVKWRGNLCYVSVSIIQHCGKLKWL